MSNSPLIREKRGIANQLLWPVWLSTPCPRPVYGTWSGVGTSGPVFPWSCNSLHNFLQSRILVDTQDKAVSPAFSEPSIMSLHLSCFWEIRVQDSGMAVYFCASSIALLNFQLKERKVYSLSKIQSTFSFLIGSLRSQCFIVERFKITADKCSVLIKVF